MRNELTGSHHLSNTSSGLEDLLVNCNVVIPLFSISVSFRRNKPRVLKLSNYSLQYITTFETLMVFATMAGLLH